MEPAHTTTNSTERCAMLHGANRQLPIANEEQKWPARAASVVALAQAARRRASKKTPTFYGNYKETAPSAGGERDEKYIIRKETNDNQTGRERREGRGEKNCWLNSLLFNRNPHVP